MNDITTVVKREFFSNGYGVSVITGGYGNEESPYEVAVIKGTKDNWLICYDTYIADDVIGYLTGSEVAQITEEVKRLTKKGERPFSFGLAKFEIVDELNEN